MSSPADAGKSSRARDRESDRWSPEKNNRTPEPNAKQVVRPFASCDIGQSMQQDRSSDIARFNQSAAATRWQVELHMHVDSEYVEHHGERFFKEEMMYGQGTGVVCEAIVDTAREQLAKWIAYVDNLTVEQRFEYVTERNMIVSDWAVAKGMDQSTFEAENFSFPQYLTEYIKIRVIPKYGTTGSMAAQQRIIAAFLYDVFVEAPPSISFVWTSESGTKERETKTKQAVFAVTSKPPVTEPATEAQSQVTHHSHVL